MCLSYDFCVFQSIPGSLPSRYQKELNRRQKQIDTWQHQVKDAGLAREQRKEFQALVESRFHVSYILSVAKNDNKNNNISPS